MATLALFIVGVISLVCFDPLVTAYVYNEPLLMWKFVSFFTHMVSHGSWTHLIGNYTFGAPFMLYLEHKLKSTKTFVRLFFALGTCSFLLQTVFNQFSMFQSMGLIGSSGAIFGLVGAALAIYDGPMPIKIAARSLLVFYIFTQFQLAMFSLIFPMGVAYAAHLGGLLGGLSFVILRHRRRHSRQNRANRSQKRRP